MTPFVLQVPRKGTWRSSTTEPACENEVFLFTEGLLQGLATQQHFGILELVLGVRKRFTRRLRMVLNSHMIHDRSWCHCTGHVPSISPLSPPSHRLARCPPHRLPMIIIPNSCLSNVFVLALCQHAYLFNVLKYMRIFKSSFASTHTHTLDSRPCAAYTDYLAVHCSSSATTKVLNKWRLTRWWG
jgi:hypothetical protein